MSQRNEFEEIFDSLNSKLKRSGISRREALKLSGLGAASLLMSNEKLKAETNKISSDAKISILIVGGGLAGISTAARLSSDLSNANITVLEPNPISVSYQAGNTFIASGLYKKSDIIYRTRDFVPSGVKVIKDKAVEFNAQSNKVKTASGKTFSYDFLVIAAGLVLDFSKIKGLEELGDTYTIEKKSLIKTLFENSGVSTAYNTDAAQITWQNMQKVIKEVKSGKKLNAVFTHPNTPVKAEGTSINMMYMMNSRLNEAEKEVRTNVDMTFYSNDSKLFKVKAYEDVIKTQFKAKNMKWKFAHNLVEVNLKDKIAVFNHQWEEKEAEYSNMIKKNDRVEVAYDFLHITPPMKVPAEIKNSEIASKKSWLPVNKESLQHIKYKNIFCLGDIVDVPLGKTGGSVRKQYKVLVDNLLSAIDEKELKAKYDGYTVCPITTDIGKVMLAEFNWAMKPTPSSFLDPTEDRYIWWLLNLYLMKPITTYGMLSGKI